MPKAQNFPPAASHDQFNLHCSLEWGDGHLILFVLRIVGILTFPNGTWHICKCLLLRGSRRWVLFWVLSMVDAQYAIRKMFLQDRRRWVVFRVLSIVDAPYTSRKNIYCETVAVEWCFYVLSMVNAPYTICETDLSIMRPVRSCG